MKVFATRVWGFNPDTWPAIGFGLTGNRDALLLASKPGHRIVFIGTQGEPTKEKYRGRLLGMAEIGRVPVDTVDVVDTAELNKPRNLDPLGRPLWPKALLMIEAWRFEPQPKLVDEFERQLTYAATTQAVELSDHDRAAVMALNAVKVSIRDTPTIQRLRLLDESLRGGKPTTGPTPSSWTGTTGRDVNRDAYTYAFRFGKHDIWKIGHTVDLGARLKQVNTHIPTEVVEGTWRSVFQHKWNDEKAAHAMEQRVFAALKNFRTEGERLRCSETDLFEAWKRAIGVV